MHIPSERVYSELRSEVASLWYVPANGDDEIALLVKVPTASIKALVAGCSLSLLFGLERNYLCVGAKIHDVPRAPVIISGVQKEEEEHRALKRLLVELTVPIFLYNEMDVCLAWTNLTLARADAARIGALLEKSFPWYTGPYDQEATFALDCFCVSIENSNLYPNAHPIEIAEVETQLEKWRIMENYFCGVHGYEEITIDNADEGEIFERMVWSSLESVFPLTLYKSPRIKDGKTEREFTDVFSFYHYGSFIIEAKDLSVLQAGYSRDQNRRVSGVKKQVKKAISQLVGAAKHFSRGEEIFDAEGRLIEVSRQQPPHCIVLITELMPCGDWSDVTDQLLKAMKETRALFHLLDLRELIVMLKASSGRPELFDYNLLQRCKLCVAENSVLIRGIPAHQSWDAEELES